MSLQRAAGLNKKFDRELPRRTLQPGEVIINTLSAVATEVSETLT